MNGRTDKHEGANGRTEPTLGDLRDLDAPSPRAFDEDDRLPRVTLDPPHRHASAHTHRPPRRWPWVLLAVLVLLGLLVLWLNQDHLRNLVPKTELNDVLTRAEIALKDGRLDGNDGTSARELFQNARALEPDNDRAREGLHQVGMAELSRADAAYRAGHLDEAQQLLGLARELLGGGSDVDRLAQSISKARGALVQTDGLVDRAQQALAASRLTGPDGAGELYRRVLAAAPDNAVAAHGLDQVGAALAGQARSALAANDIATAQADVDQLAALLPQYGELPSLRASLALSQQSADAKLNDALAQGQAALRAGRVAGAGDDTALAHFKAALALDPNNAPARAGLGQVAQALIVQANAAIDGGDATQATALLDQAASLAPKSADLAAARARLEDRENPAPTPPPLSAAQIAQVADLVQQARAAATRGEIMLPPGGSAYDLYRNALAIDGSNQAAQQGLQDLPHLVVQLFNQALGGNDLGKAGELLNSLNDLAPGDTSQELMRDRLADAWLDQAEQQLARGDRGGAMQSLAQARKLAPLRPRIGEVAARLQGGG